MAALLDEVMHRPALPLARARSLLPSEGGAGVLRWRELPAAPGTAPRCHLRALQVPSLGIRAAGPRS
jgi:hypothetical protein